MSNSKSQQIVGGSGKQLLNYFNHLQAFANQAKVSIDIPEFVIIGSQSSGKSSLLEAFLGYRFNFISDKIATRRPLILQCFPDPQEKDAPSWNLIQVGSTVLNLTTKSPQHIAKKIEEYNSIDYISDEAIVLHVKYAYCARLTVIDLPGIRLVGDPALAESIKELVRQQIKAENRIIICVENAGSDYTGFAALQFVQQHADPTSKRTVLAINKFDMIVPGLLTKNPENYLRGDPTAINPEVPRFYTSVQIPEGNPNFREGLYHLSSMHRKELRTKMIIPEQEAEELLKRVGFDNLREYLEARAEVEMRRTLPEIQKSLSTLQKASKQKLENIEKALKDLNIEVIRSSMVRIGANIAKNIETQMMGDYQAAFWEKYGQTLQSESAEFKALYPGYQKAFELSPELINGCIQDHGSKLYGGSQYLRLLKLIELSIRAKELPKMTEDQLRIAKATLLQGLVSWTAAVTKLMKEDAKGIFVSDLEASCARLKMIAHRMLPLALEMLDDESKAFLEAGKFFKDIITENYNAFIENCYVALCDNIKKFVASCTNTIRFREGKLPTTHKDSGDSVVERIKREMNIEPSEPLWFEEALNTSKQHPDKEIVHAANQLANAYFKQIRDYVAVYVELLFDLNFKTPIMTTLPMFLTGTAGEKIEAVLGPELSKKKEQLLLQKQEEELRLHGLEDQLRQIPNLMN